MWLLLIVWLLAGQMFWNFLIANSKTGPEYDNVPVALYMLFCCWVCGPFMWWWTYNKVYYGTYTGFRKGMIPHDL